MAKFKKGQSGNPKGRPKGIVDRRRLYRELIDTHVPQIVNQVVTAALNGDITACKLLLDRAVPCLRSEYEASAIPEKGKSAIENAAAVIEAMLDGTMSPEKAQSAIGTIAGYQQITEVAQMEARLESLERKYAKT